MAEKSSEKVVKPRLLVLSKMFYELTDEAHPMSTFEIIDYLAENGVPANTKTLRSDLKLLKDMDIDIVTVPGRPNKYFLGARLFEMPEVKLLLDAVASSRFITKRKSKELSLKLASLSSGTQRKQLIRHMYTTGRVKPGNENIFYYIDIINNAIELKKKISFKITEFDGRKKKTQRNSGEIYVISPYAMYWNDDYYYAVGWSDKRKKMVANRIDRMEDLQILDEKAEKKPKGFRLTDYSHKVFEMFDGEEVRVMLECRNDLMKYVIDRFGMKFETEPATDDTTYCYVDVCLSPTFYGWVFGFGGDIRIVEPATAVDKMKKMLKSMTEAEADIQCD
ncbi:MAG: WYL domain-containing protein [Mogibacterium sp.]|jgi:predicted DNA-binding transcriptional regulator YafY|nr:WYL domain-containing protein [Mogibacterium sp.]